MDNTILWGLGLGLRVSGVGVKDFPQQWPLKPFSGVEGCYCGYLGGQVGCKG